MSANSKRWLAIFAALLLIAITTSLGFWQLSRAQQKIELQQLRQQRHQAQALDVLHAGTDWQYRRATATGVWRNQDTVWIDNRQQNGQAGYWLVTPLQLDNGQFLLVLRGWLPRLGDSRGQLPSAPTTQFETVTGELLATIPATYSLGPDDAKQALQQNLSLPAFAQSRGLNLLPFVLRQTGADSDGLGRQWFEPASKVQTNYSYAAQWFAMALLTLGCLIWFAWVARPKPPAHLS